MFLMSWQRFQCVIWAHLCAECYWGTSERKALILPSGAHDPLRGKACVQRQDGGKMCSVASYRLECREGRAQQRLEKNELGGEESY